MNLVNKIKIELTSNKIGSDEFGNCYFEAKKPDECGKYRRFVVYNGKAEASKVPPHWHSWLHYTSNQVPSTGDSHKYSWQKIHLPNLTGTIYEHSPSNISVKKDNRKLVSSDYESWNPNQSNN